jgi:hypothetical protein
MGRSCSTNGEKRKACSILVGKPEDERPLGRPRCTSRWQDNIKIDLREMGLTGLMWLRTGTSGGLL